MPIFPQSMAVAQRTCLGLLSRDWKPVPLVTIPDGARIVVVIYQADARCAAIVLPDAMKWTRQLEHLDRRAKNNRPETSAFTSAAIHLVLQGSKKNSSMSQSEVAGAPFCI
jgi:hypothetical protein